MSIGNSGRIVIEIEPEAKRRLYAALAYEGLTLKDWFLKNAEKYLVDRRGVYGDTSMLSNGPLAVAPIVNSSGEK
ncbi:hypothetical protein D9M09_25490 [Janthinobacterium agaricidamnosum]|jgi:hypothetical protein|uniref:Uncharacterized protein n=1 Tax=Janthinobacterium agaricidamnosum TaxID=55508 RepID=A0A3G2EGG0_9BURK|nr:hypothetical protein [Janthinobacterium agaricidamnosum]AYM78766.1 hypothetical protein D9M09_25490 [Janthinobacterium agaricidamnosum]